MRKVFVILAVLMAVSITAQTHELSKHNGEKTAINYIKTENNVVCFSYPNSSEEFKISKYAVHSLTDTSSRKTQSISSKIDVKNKNSFREVVFLKDFETIGLKKGEEISVFMGRTKGFSHHDLVQTKNRRLKQKAAQKGSPFVVITSELYDEIKAVLYYY